MGQLCDDFGGESGSIFKKTRLWLCDVELQGRCSFLDADKLQGAFQLDRLGYRSRMEGLPAFNRFSCRLMAFCISWQILMRSGTASLPLRTPGPWTFSCRTLCLSLTLRLFFAVGVPCP
jgi:hypothetical protein